MSTIAVNRTLTASVPQVWEKLADFGGIHRYSGGVEASPINPGTPETGLGAERNCALYDGNHIQERITEFRPQERLALEVFETSMPLAEAMASFDLKATEAGGCELTMTMNYTVKYGPVGWLMDQLMLRKAMSSSLERLLAALDEHLKTGAEIPQGWRPAA